MRKLWDFWKNKKYGKKSMTGWFLLTNALLCGGIGAALWGVVSLVALKGISWLIIFAGYAIVFPGFLGGVLFAMNTETTMDELEINYSDREAEISEMVFPLFSIQNTNTNLQFLQIV